MKPDPRLLSDNHFTQYWNDLLRGGPFAPQAIRNHIDALTEENKLLWEEIRKHTEWHEALQGRGTHIG